MKKISKSHAVWLSTLCLFLPRSFRTSCFSRLKLCGCYTSTITICWALPKHWFTMESMKVPISSKLPAIVPLIIHFKDPYQTLGMPQTKVATLKLMLVMQEIPHQLITIVYPMIYKNFIHQRWLLEISEPSTVVAIYVAPTFHNPSLPNNL